MCSQKLGLLGVCNCWLKVEETIQSSLIGHVGCFPLFLFATFLAYFSGDGFLELEVLIQRSYPFSGSILYLFIYYKLPAETEEIHSIWCAHRHPWECFSPALGLSSWDLISLVEERTVVCLRQSWSPGAPEKAVLGREPGWPRTTATESSVCLRPFLSARMSFLGT